MNTTQMADLLSEILDSQIESGEYGGIDRKRFEKALTCGPPLQENELQLLLLSPVARSDYNIVRQRIADQLKKRLQKQRIELELLPLAASTDGEKIVMQGNGFAVTLYQKEELGIPWIILVQLEPKYSENIDPMTVLQLIDTGGLEWLRGRPDRNGELTGAWDDRQTDLLARSKRFSLILQPV